MKPSGKFQGFATSTPEHDLLQLWVSQAENQKKIVEIFRDKIHSSCRMFNNESYEHIDESVELKLEQPIYSGPNKFLIGIVDGWVWVTNNFKYKDIDRDDDHSFRIIYEIKPQLNSISQAIGQITTYSDFLGISEYRPGGLLIITLEESTKFDNMLLQQGIRVLHVKESELIK